MLKSIVESLAIPPVSLVFLIVFGLSLGRGRAGLILAGIGVAGLVLLALPIVANSMIVALEQDLPLTPPSNATPKAIVILGGDVSRIVGPPTAIPGRLTLDRLRAGAALRRRTGLPVLVTGGPANSGDPSVAAIMADSLRDDFRVPVEWVEEAATDTWENAALSAAILKKKGINSVYVVTHGWHMRRAVIAFHNAGLTVTAAPVALDAPGTRHLADFLPRVLAWERSYLAIHEWIGGVWYQLR